MGLEGHDHDVGLKMCQCSVYSILYSNILYIYIVSYSIMFQLYYVFIYSYYVA